MVSQTYMHPRAHTHNNSYPLHAGTQAVTIVLDRLFRAMRSAFNSWGGGQPPNTCWTDRMHACMYACGLVPRYGWLCSFIRYSTIKYARDVKFVMNRLLQRIIAAAASRFYLSIPAKRQESVDYTRRYSLGAASLALWCS